jgi:hypothetical protein
MTWDGRSEMESSMSKRLLTLSTATLIAATIAAASGVASAMPVADALAIKNAASSDVQPVLFWGWGWGVSDGYVASVPYVVPAVPFAVPVVPYAVPVHSYADAIAYCARRYRSYDPDTGTYVGRHGAVLSCP